MNKDELVNRIANLETALENVLDLFNPQSYEFEGEGEGYEDIVMESEGVLVERGFVDYEGGEDADD